MNRLFIPVLAAGGLPPASTGPTTDSDVVLLIVYILLALIFSFLCSIAEAVLLSITPSYIAGLKENHPKRADLIRRLKQENVDQSLAAILTLNTIAHTVGAIGSGAKATAVFGSAWFGVFSAVMTMLILFLSEIIPKTLGAVFWKSLARPTAIFVQWLIFLLYPLIWLSERLTKLIVGRKNIHVLSRDEFIAMTDVGEEHGQIDEHESWIIRNLLQLSSLRASDIMTPRTVVEALQQDLSVEQAMNNNLQHSRLPIYDQDLDSVTGLVLKDDVLLLGAKGEISARLTEMKRPIPSVPESVTLSRLLESFLDDNVHLALVVNEYGGTSGVVSLEDILETLVGKEIVDESDQVDDMQELARHRWRKRARQLGLSPASGESDGDKPVDGAASEQTTKAAEETSSS